MLSGMPVNVEEYISNALQRQARRTSKPTIKEWKHRQQERLLGSTQLQVTWI
jgi:hypothetical protein